MGRPFTTSVDRSSSRHSRVGWLLSLWLLLLLAPLPAHAIFGFEPHFRHGAVYARALVRSDAGNPYWATYDASGELVAVLGEATGDMADLTLMSATEFESYVALLADYRANDVDGLGAAALLVDRDAYETTTWLTLDDRPIAAPPLQPATRSVLLRAREDRFLTDGSQLVLQEFPVDLVASPSLPSGQQSVLLNEDGSIHLYRADNIGYQAAFYGDSNRALGRDYDDELHGPVGGALIEIGAFLGGRTISNNDGRYSLSYVVPPCPGFWFEYTSPIYAELRYRNFNPQGAASIPYYLRRSDYTICNGLGAFPPSYTLGGLMTQVAVIGILASQPQPIYRADFPVDVMMLTGFGSVTNAGIAGAPTVRVGSETRYDPATEPMAPEARTNFDFDLDGVRDLAVLGEYRIVDGARRFAPAAGGPVQGIYLSSGSRDPSAADPDDRQPDFTRLADADPVMRDQGLLDTLSLEDLENTDLYVFRKSNGKLVMERRGLADSEVGSYVDSQADADASKFIYRILIRGPGDFLSLLQTRHPDFADWQSRAGMDPSLHARDADHLRPGEPIEIIAINRATGYIGSVDTTLKSADEGSGLAEISFPIREILMRPPNLKLTARRAYQIDHGADAGERAEYRVGYEGAGLVSDTYIEVRSEWFDHDGTALPQELGDYGYTGRLARVSGPDSLSPVGGALAEFPIRPGLQLQLVSLPDQAALDTQHFHVHVSGEPASGNPDFGAGLAGGALTGRPARYVPVRVDVYDDERTIEQQTRWRELRAANPEVELEEPGGVYVELYRPEFQFSVFDLQVRDIEREALPDEPESILLDPVPAIASGEALLRVLYDLSAPTLDPLPMFGPERELVLAIGEQELRAQTIGAAALVFDDLTHLGKLESTDLLTLRLLASNDPANVLWQMSFADFGVYPQEGGSISADDAAGYVTALIGHPDGAVVDFEVIQGSGSLDAPTVESEGNAAVTQLQTLTDPGTIYRVRATLRSIPGRAGLDVARETGPIEVLAGAPDRIELTASRDGYRSDATDEIKLTARIYDQFDNPVEDETGLVWSVDESTSSFVQADQVTLGGQATAVIRAPKLPIDQTVTVRAGDAEATLTLTVDRVTGSLVSSAAVLDLNLQETATLTASVDAADGTPVFWLTSNGRIEGASVVSGGSATATLSTEGGYVGPVVVTATIGDRLLHWEGQVNSSATLFTRIDHPVIVAGEQGEQVGQFTRADGTVRNIGYWGSTAVEVVGTPGASVFVGSTGEDLRDAWDLGALAGGIVESVLGDRDLAFVGAAAVAGAAVDGGPALRLDGSGEGRLSRHADFEFEDSFSLSLRVRSTAPGEALLVGNDVWSLRTLADGRLRATVERRDAAPLTVETGVALTPDQWQLVTLGYDANGLRLTLDGRAWRSYTGPGTLQASTTDILVGTGFEGYLDDLRLLGSTAGQRLSIEGVGLDGAVTLDGSGRATVQVLNTGLASGEFAARLPISVVRPGGGLAGRRSGSIFPSAWAADAGEASQGYVQVVERNWWFYTKDTVASFFGADPQSGAGIASNVAGGMLIVADVGSLIKNGWRATGWSDVEPNAVEVVLSGIGLGTELAVGAGEVADAPVSGVRAIAASLGNTPFVRILATRVKGWVTGEIASTAAERTLITALASGDDALIGTMNALARSDELYEGVIRAATDLGDEFYDVLKGIATTPPAGLREAEDLVRALSNTSEAGISALRNSSTALAESLPLLARAGTKVGPELMSEIMGNTHLYTAAYDQAKLLRDIDVVLDVPGFDDLAKMLRTGNKGNVLKQTSQVAGYRFELESAANLARGGIYEVVELSKRVGVQIFDDAGDLIKDGTDIDIVVRALSSADDIFAQVKRSAGALKGLKHVKVWVAQARQALGVVDGARIRYILPDGVRVPKNIQEWLAQEGIEIIRLPNL